MKITGAKKISAKPIMAEYLQERNRNEFNGGGDYYITGIKKLAEIKAAKHRAKKISMIAEGIELAEQRKDFFNIYR
jgi:hypothetical protein|tara:strand:- start:10452 stop:10679 length:228 start_codon:yes stop_codon:yes gene_type:complete